MLPDLVDMQRSMVSFVHEPLFVYRMIPSSIASGPSLACDLGGEGCHVAAETSAARLLLRAMLWLQHGLFERLLLLCTRGARVLAQICEEEWLTVKKAGV